MEAAGRLRSNPAILLLLLLLLLAGGSSGDTLRGPRDSTVAESWERMEETLRVFVDNLLKQIMPSVLKASKSANITGDCAGGLLQLILGLRRMEPWAFRMIDAAGKPPPGMLKGTVTALGAYDECLDVSVPNQLDVGTEYFRGQYCTITLVPPLPPKKPYYTLQETLAPFLNFSQSGATVIREISRVAHLFYFLKYRFDVCIPSVCTREDLEKLINHVIKNLNLQVSVPECTPKRDLEIPNHVVIILIVLGVLIALSLAGGFVDFCHETFPDSKTLARYTSNSLCKVLNIFSFIANIERVLDTKISYPRTAVLYGMTFLTTTWVVLANSYFDMSLQIFSNLFEMTQYPKSFAFQVIINSTLSVDTYFFISGVLTMFTTLTWVRDSGRFNLFHYLGRRLWRMVPPYALMLGIFLVIGTVGDGPTWRQSITPVTAQCEKYWWTNLLFINNIYLKPEERCLKSTWYMACDMQLYILALLVILPCLRWPIVGLSIDGIFIVASMVANGYITYDRGYPPTLLMAHPDPEQRSDWEYHLFNHPLTHLGSHGIGMAVGYLLYRYERGPSLRWYQLGGGWIAAGSAAMAVVYGVYDWNNGVVPSTFARVLYASSHRMIWALALAWTTVVCAYGRGGYIDKILSWRPLVPLSRLTLLVLLLHPMLQLAIVGYLQERIYTTHTMAIFFFLGQLACSLGLSFLLTLSVERPFLALRRKALGWPPEAPTEHANSPAPPYTKEDAAKLYLSNGELLIVATAKSAEKIPPPPSEVAVCHL